MPLRRRRMLHAASLEFPGPEFVAVVGPMARASPRYWASWRACARTTRGHCEYAGNGVSRWRRRAFAREVCFLPQSLKMEFPFTPSRWF